MTGKVVSWLLGVPTANIFVIYMQPIILYIACILTITTKNNGSAIMGKFWRES